MNQYEDGWVSHRMYLQADIGKRFAEGGLTDMIVEAD